MDPGACDRRQGTAAFQEALSDEYMSYVVQVAKNAKVMAAGIYTRRGVQDHFRGNRQSPDVDRSEIKNLTGKLANEETLIKADITINKNMVPF